MRVVDLNGPWMLKGFDAGKGDRDRAHDPHYDDSDWMEAHVPGVVHLDLIRLKKIPHPFYGLNELEVKWVEDKDWWYRKRLVVDDEVLRSDRVELVFEGLDTFATVWVNGKEVGRFSNMFRRHRIDVKDLLRRGENVVAVKFDSPTRTLERLYAASDVKLAGAFYFPVVYGRKAQYSFGWDWGPRLPTSGIWRPVWLRACNTCVIDSYYFTSEIEASERNARATCELSLDAFREQEVEVDVSLAGHGYVDRKIEKRKLTIGQNRFTFEFHVKDPKLWWPNGYGDQALYDLGVSVTRDGTALDKLSKRVGFRRIEVVQEKDDEGKTFQFRVNGALIFCKGANWVPADSFLPQVTRDRYDYLLSKAKEANMNMLRVWGGGVYESEDFYELCDEKGIMIWQDFMFACAEYPEEDWFLEECRKEAEEVVKRLRNHACLAIWCGNNENDWGFKAGWFGKRDAFYGHTIYHKILPEVCARLDPSTFYWPSSPYGGEDPNSQSEGDRHSWDVWSGMKDYSEYLKDKGRFVSEFGFQSLPSMETIEKFTAPEDRYPQSRVIEHHNKQVNGPERLVWFLSHHFKVPSDLKTFAYLTQVNQGEAMKTGIMHWRRRKFRTAGALIWQLDDCWPVASWSLIDYYGDLKASYYYTKRAFDSVALSLVLNGDMIEAWITNDLLDEKKGTLEIVVFNSKDKRTYRKKYEIDVPANSSKLIARIPISEIKKADPPTLVVTGILKVKGLEERQDTLFLDEPKHIALRKPEIKITKAKALDKSNKRFEVGIASDTLVKALSLQIKETEATFSDNCFDIPPETERRVEVTLERPTKPSELRKRLQFVQYGPPGARRLRCRLVASSLDGKERHNRST
jgi:beta-mannosidase